MAWAKGTATDFIDALRKFRDYAAGLIDPASHATINQGTLVTGANATGALTLTANAGNGETVTIGGKAYTFQTTLTDVDGNVLIGANASASLDNLIAAINLGSGSGTLYAAATTLHPSVTAAAGPGDSMIVTANLSGVSGNAIATTETLANGSWGGATLTGGSGDRWSILPNGPITGIPGSGFATDGEVYLSGPGSDPADQIVVGIRTSRNAGANIFRWELRGFTAFNNALTFDSMPGVSPSARAAFDDATFNVHFWVNARRIMMVATVGTTNVLVHAGFIQQFGTRQQYPYPLYIAGSASTDVVSFQTANFSHSCLPDPCHDSAWLRWIDGTWRASRNYGNSTSAQRGIARLDTGSIHVWPLVDPTVGVFLPSTTFAESRILENWSATTTELISSAEVAAYAAFPAILMEAAADIGRIDGLYMVPGLGLVSGDTLTISGTTYDVFSNTWRSEYPDFFAIPRV